MPDITDSRGATLPMELRPRARITRVIEPEPTMVSGRSIAASGRVEVLHPYPVEPPKDWFARREFDCATPIVVTAEGQIHGHAVDWQTAHTASTSYGRKALRAPHCVERNQRFLNRNTLCDDGSLVATGPIYMDCSHTVMSLPGAMVQDAMAHSGMAIADVAVYEDFHGLQVAGAVRPSATRLQVRVLRGNSDLSPHWAPAAHFGHRGGGHVLLGLVAVNESGLPVRGIAASGYPAHPWIQWDATLDEPQTMVAVGVVHRRPSALTQVQAQLAAHDSILGEVVADRAMREATARAGSIAARRR